MNGVRVLRSALLVAAAVLPCAAPADDIPWSIVREGAFHGGEAPSQPGDGWFALTQRAGRWRLSPSLVLARPVPDPVVDGEDDRSGIEIESEVPGALALLRHASLRAGPAPAAVWAETPREQRRQLALDAVPQRFELAGTPYRIGMGRVKPADADAPNAEIRLVRKDGSSVLVARDRHDEDRVVTIAWAGDLNHDGSPDFLVDHDGYNTGNFCWYLSQAGGREYRQVGCQRTTGC